MDQQTERVCCLLLKNAADPTNAVCKVWCGARLTAAAAQLGGPVVGPVGEPEDGSLGGPVVDPAGWANWTRNRPRGITA